MNVPTDVDPTEAAALVDVEAKLRAPAQAPALAPPADESRNRKTKAMAVRRRCSTAISMVGGHSSLKPAVAGNNTLEQGQSRKQGGRVAFLKGKQRTTLMTEAPLESFVQAEETDDSFGKGNDSRDGSFRSGGSRLGRSASRKKEAHFEKKDPTSSKPMMVALLLRSDIQIIATKGVLNPPQLANFASRVEDLVQAYLNMHKIDLLILPLPYSQLLKIFSMCVATHPIAPPQAHEPPPRLTRGGPRTPLRLV